MVTKASFASYDFSTPGPLIASHLSASLPVQRRRADTAVVIALLRVKAVALILLGAQVIAELERTVDELTDEKLSGFET